MSNAATDKLKDGDRFRGPDGEVYEIRGQSFQCYDLMYYPAAEIDADGRNIVVANWPEVFFLRDCTRLKDHAK